jgi:hypothetical protein
MFKFVYNYCDINNRIICKTLLVLFVKLKNISSILFSIFNGFINCSPYEYLNMLKFFAISFVPTVQ